ncbi:hypothetical protein [Spiroplasma alleghenense]|uniref:Uncharacterized protein n=1 Tax=Spiroplasma alleghenense TaxID=216931 RepID=A0A345Z433_9MOLU|nr:hypothetical protein [Spiroplasma alleghenense]AXK51362.1 hypothetical protein SALLE_v1c06920 [Spiroplasma alleghenense]
MQAVRSRIIIYNYIGMFFSVFFLGLYITALFGNVEGFSLAMNDFTPVEQTLLVMVLAFLFYSLWKTIYFGMTIIKFVKTKSDEDIIANRFMLAVYSLTLGGFLTPWMLTKIPNVDSNSTLNPRNEIAKVYTKNYVIGGSIFIASYFAIAAALKVNVFATQDAQLASYIFLGITGAAIALGLVGGIFFWKKNSAEAYEKSGFMKFIAGIFIFIVTLELILKIISAILTIIDAIADIARSNDRNFLMKFLIWMNSLITIMYSIFLIKICWATIKGIWSKNGVTMKEFAGLTNAEEKQGRTPSWKTS